MAKTQNEVLKDATEKGYLGTTPDDTPDANYTVAGVTSGKPTPETIKPGSPGSTKSDPDLATPGLQTRPK